MRPIDGDALKERFEMLSYDDWNQGAGTTWANAYSEAADIVEKEITIDAVEVVRCKDCMVLQWCRFAQGLGLDGFCSQGERREEDGKSND